MEWAALLAIFYNGVVLPVGDANLAALIWTTVIVVLLSRMGLGFEGAVAAGAGFLLMFGATAFLTGGGALYIVVIIGIAALVFLGFMRVVR